MKSQYFIIPVFLFSSLLLIILHLCKLYIGVFWRTLYEHFSMDKPFVHWHLFSFLCLSSFWVTGISSLSQLLSIVYPLCAWVMMSQLESCWAELSQFELCWVTGICSFSSLSQLLSIVWKNHSVNLLSCCAAVWLSSLSLAFSSLRLPTSASSSPETGKLS